MEDNEDVGGGVMSAEHHIDQLKMVRSEPFPCDGCGIIIDPNNPPVRLLITLSGEIYCSRQCYEKTKFQSSTVEVE